MGHGAPVVEVARPLRALTLAFAALAAAAGARPAYAQRVASLPGRDCSATAFVPPLAPDTIAQDVLDSLGTITVASRPGVSLLKNVIAARFDTSATQMQRQAAVDRVCGVVIGGDRGGDADGYYLVRLHGAGNVEMLDAAADVVRHMPGVASAQTLSLHRTDVADAPPAAASGPAETSCADGSTGGLLRIDAVKEMLASRDAGEIRLMNDLGLGGVDSSAVQVVDDVGVCARVASAILRAAHFELTDSPYVVLRAGPRYVAFDPRGYNRAFFLVDSTFSFRTVLR